MYKLVTSCFCLTATLLFNSMAFGQQRSIDMAINIDEPENGGVYQPGETIPFSVSVTNNGPDDIIVGDTLFVILPDGSPTFGTMTEVVTLGNTADLFSTEITLPMVTGNTSFQLCVQLIDDPSSQITMGGSPISVSYIDPNPANNLVCHSFSIEPSTSLAGLSSGADDFTVYPNPASSYVRVTVEESATKPVVISLYDLLGRTIRTVQCLPVPGKDYIQINVSDLQQGIYILERNDGESQATTKLQIKY